MNLIKVIIIGLIVSILSIFLKQVKSEYAIFCVIIGGIIILGYILNSVVDILGFFEMIIEKTGVSNQLFVTMLKVIGIGYLVEFSASVCRDSGNSSIAEKIVLAGKIMIFLISMPIVETLFNLVLDML